MGALENRGYKMRTTPEGGWRDFYVARAGGPMAGESLAMWTAHKVAPVMGVTANIIYEKIAASGAEGRNAASEDRTRRRGAAANRECTDADWQQQICTETSTTRTSKRCWWLDGGGSLQKT